MTRPLLLRPSPGRALMCRGLSRGEDRMCHCPSPHAPFRESLVGTRTAAPRQQGRGRAVGPGIPALPATVPQGLPHQAREPPLPAAALTTPCPVRLGFSHMTGTWRRGDGVSQANHVGPKTGCVCLGPPPAEEPHTGQRDPHIAPGHRGLCPSPCSADAGVWLPIPGEATCSPQEPPSLCLFCAKLASVL